MSVMGDVEREASLYAGHSLRVENRICVGVAVSVMTSQRELVN